MAYFRIGLYKVADNKLYDSKTFSAADLATALTNSVSDAEFTAFGTVSTSGSGTTYVVRALENSTSSYINILLLAISNAYYSAINTALSAFGVIGGVLNDSSPTVATEGNVAPTRITSYRALHTNLRNNSGTEIGTTTTPLVTQNAGTSKTITRYNVNISASGTTTVLAGQGSGTFIKIVAYHLENTAGSSNMVMIKSASTSINGTGFELAADGGYRQFTGVPGSVELKLGDNEALVLDLGSANQLSGFILYRID